jgi:hypothetical protein
VCFRGGLVTFAASWVAMLGRRTRTASGQLGNGMCSMPAFAIKNPIVRICQPDRFDIHDFVYIEHLQRAARLASLVLALLAESSSTLLIGAS